MKLRKGFVSNSSSSSFTAFIDIEEYDKIEFTSVERAVLETVGISSQMLGNIELIEVSFMEGNWDDLDGISMESFAQKVIKWSIAHYDPMLEEYREEYRISCKNVEESAKEHVKNYMFSNKLNEDSFKYFMELFSISRTSICKKFKELKGRNLCVIKEMDF